MTAIFACIARLFAARPASTSANADYYTELARVSYSLEATGLYV